MNLRIPGGAELCALFTSPTTVAAAVVDLNRAMARVQNVVAHTAKVAKREIDRAAYLRGQADTAAASAARQQAEGERALRVANNLKELIA